MEPNNKFRFTRMRNRLDDAEAAANAGRFPDALRHINMLELHIEFLKRDLKEIAGKPNG